MGELKGGWFNKAHLLQHCGTSDEGGDAAGNVIAPLS